MIDDVQVWIAFAKERRYRVDASCVRLLAAKGALVEFRATRRWSRVIALEMLVLPQASDSVPEALSVAPRAANKIAITIRSAHCDASDLLWTAHQVADADATLGKHREGAHVAYENAVAGYCLELGTDEHVVEVCFRGVTVLTLRAAFAEGLGVYMEVSLVSAGLGSLGACGNGGLCTTWNSASSIEVWVESGRSYASHHSDRIGD